jgi:diphthamide synthase subunit DPH2
MRKAENMLPFSDGESLRKLIQFPTIEVYEPASRISMEAPFKFSKPVLTPNEFMVVSGEVSWENLLKKGLFEN